MVDEADTHEEDVSWQAGQSSHHVARLDREDDSLKDDGKVFGPEGEHAEVLALCGRPGTGVGQRTWGRGSGRGRRVIRIEMGCTQQNSTAICTCPIGGIHHCHLCALALADDSA